MNEKLLEIQNAYAESRLDRETALQKLTEAVGNAAHAEEILHQIDGGSDVVEIDEGGPE